MEEIYFRKVMTAVMLLFLLVLSFLLLKSILLSIIFAFVLAFIFVPVYDFFYKLTKSKNISAGLVCTLLILLIVIPIWFLTPVLVNQAIEFYISSQQLSLIDSIQGILPSLSLSPEFSLTIESIIQSSITKTINSIGTVFTIDNLVNFFFQGVVVVFTFFFVLRDRKELLDYVRSLLPFSKDVENKLIQSSKGITAAVLYGQVVVGILQGLIVGVGFFILGAPHALLLTALACLAGIFPVVGTTIIWVPVLLYFLFVGNAYQAIGLLIFGVISSSIDNFLRPIIVSKRAKIHTSVILIGMIGGLFFFGILGIILGPLILAYLLIILELYRNKGSPGIITNLSKKRKSR